jgi:hypothetical protein
MWEHGQNEPPVEFLDERNLAVDDRQPAGFRK